MTMINVNLQNQTANSNTELQNDMADKILKETTNLLRKCDLTFLHHFLKLTTDEAHAMSASEIAEQMNFLIPTPDNVKGINADFYNEKTMKRKLDEITSGEEHCHKILSLMRIIMGGSIKYREADGLTNKSKKLAGERQKRFYFDPVLKASDVDMIYGAIESSRYLSDEEKEFLLSRLTILLPSFAYDSKGYDFSKYKRIDELLEISGRPNDTEAANSSINHVTLLSNINAIHSAIVDAYQIEVIYGKYTVDDNTKQLLFTPVNPDTPYILNPYAMFWNDGEYYLIATHKEYTNTAHFRVDRIISVKPHMVIDDKTNYLETAKRRPVPDTLRPFFKKESGKTMRFDNIAFSNHYPQMQIHEAEDLIDCTFECTERQLQMIIDSFGSKINIKKINSWENSDEKYVLATVKKVQYQSALSFALGHARYITVKSPDRLVNDISATLKEILERYNC